MMPSKLMVMKKDRFSVISESKFERLSKKELQESKGGICVSCKKRTRNVPIVFFPSDSGHTQPV